MRANLPNEFVLLDKSQSVPTEFRISIQRINMYALTLLDDAHFSASANL